MCTTSTEQPFYTMLSCFAILLRLFEHLVKQQKAHSSNVHPVVAAEPHNDMHPANRSIKVKPGTV